MFEDYERDFLRQGVQQALITQLFNPAHWIRADNLGLRMVIDRVEGLRQLQQLKLPVRNILVILVNAEVNPEQLIEQTAAAPSIGATMGAVRSGPAAPMTGPGNAGILGQQHVQSRNCNAITTRPARPAIAGTPVLG